MIVQCVMIWLLMRIIKPSSLYCIIFDHIGQLRNWLYWSSQLTPRVKWCQIIDHNLTIYIMYMHSSDWWPHCWLACIRNSEAHNIYLVLNIISMTGYYFVNLYFGEKYNSAAISIWSRNFNHRKKKKSFFCAVMQQT